MALFTQRLSLCFTIIAVETKNHKEVFSMKSREQKIFLGTALLGVLISAASGILYWHRCR